MAKKNIILKYGCLHFFRFGKENSTILLELCCVFAECSKNPANEK